MIYPNPSEGIFNVEFLMRAVDEVVIEISNAVGQRVYTATEKNVGQDSKKKLTLEFYQQVFTGFI